MASPTWKSHGGSPMASFKYNPAFLTDDELERSLVVRRSDRDHLLSVIRENVDDSNQHVLVIGPRGSGKTTLALSISAAVRRDPELRQRWQPVVFAEESYEVGSPGELWLEALRRLAEQSEDAGLLRSHAELRAVTDDVALRERALAQLVEHADDGGRRLLLVIENLNMILGEGQLSEDDAWALRHTLLNEPRIMLLATATASFEEIEGEDKALFEIFKQHPLPPLTTEECQEVWRSVSGEEVSRAQARPIEILTGGNPRLLSIVACFASKRSFKELMDELSFLIDDHTDYFKSQIESLPRQERKVYLALATLWEPSTARQVAEEARLGISPCSALLNRLQSRGAITSDAHNPRKKRYQVAERLFNIYYLMRRHGDASRRVQAVVRFMVSFYREEEWRDIAHGLTSEACRLPASDRGMHALGYRALLELAPDDDTQLAIFLETPQQFLKELPREVKRQVSSVAAGSVKSKALRLIDGLSDESADDLSIAGLLYASIGQYELSREQLTRSLELDPDSPRALAVLGTLYQRDRARAPEAEQAYRRALEGDPSLWVTWCQLGSLLAREPSRLDEAIEAYREGLKLTSSLPREELDEEFVALQWRQLGQLYLERRQPLEAATALRTAVEQDPATETNWRALLHAQSRAGSSENVIETYHDATLHGHERLAADLALALLEELRIEEARNYLERLTSTLPEFSLGWALLGRAMAIGGHHDEAEQLYRKAIDLGSDGEAAVAWHSLGELYQGRPQGREESEHALRQAVALERDHVFPVSSLVSHLLSEGREQDAIAEAEQFLAVGNKPAEDLTTLAVEFVFSTAGSSLPQVETWLRQALTLNPEQANAHLTLAFLLARKGALEEALAPFAGALGDAELVRTMQAMLTSLFAHLAAAGLAQEALDTLEAAPTAHLLEPLVVGLQLDLDMPVNAPREVVEVGRDVLEQIQERRAELESRQDEATT
ncbi:MAG: tetratricopeptide repeat protein [Acidobacteriota bacterium]